MPKRKLSNDYVVANIFNFVNDDDDDDDDDDDEDLYSDDEFDSDDLIEF